MEIQIIEFEPQYRDDFKMLNVEWLQKYFAVEPFDEHQLSNPETEILDKGGRIFFAKADDKIVGTASLLNEQGEYEVAKMAVTEDFKGHGIGSLFMNRCIEEAKKLGLKKLILISNRSLIPALTMYEKFGFREVSLGEVPYERGNIKMELNLRT
ncbi:GNAT family N-acetyltransferase [Chryseobacterium sp. R2A-55]|uniref:GNAT family N-acetyltransferase n=1 Tax=Chryseobacterium sp. R2A-55 TaxID=2744445 RepID=UPI001F27B5C0|nr:GNAT family N-acetyltransferase [Chryseobacterium sp. R2A-55]